MKKQNLSRKLHATDADELNFMTVADVTRAIGISRPTTIAWINNGTLPRPIKVGPFRGWRRQTLVNWFEQKEQGRELANK